MTDKAKGGVVTTKTDEPHDRRVLHSLEHLSLLNSIYSRIHEASSFMDALPEVEPDMLALLRAERLTVYQRGRQDREIVSRYKTGMEVKEIRVPLSTSSIAGYVAMSHQAVCIPNVYDADSLASIHSNLRFDSSFDQRTGFRTRSMIVVPIKYKNILLGVLQIINRVGGGTFLDKDLARAQELARIIGQKFHYDLRGTQGPFELLVERKKITRERFNQLSSKALAEKGSITQLLVTEARLTSEEIGASLEFYYQVPFMKYDPELELPGELMRSLNEAYLRANMWVPVGGDRDKAIILIDNPNDSRRIMEIQKILNALTYELRVGLPEDILRFLSSGTDVAKSDADLVDLVGRLGDEAPAAVKEDLSDAALVDENEATIIQLVNRLIVDADRMKASDIHIEPSRGRQPARVRMRVDGECREVLQIPDSHMRAVVTRIKIMAKLDITERGIPQSGKCGLKLGGRPIDLRVATLLTVNGESVVLRMLASSGALPFDRLNLSERNREQIVHASDRSHGLFLVVGPTGSGKTTTLHAILGRINTPERKIWVAEDPVEIVQPGLQQVQVKPAIGFDFQAALRAFLRADPDVILIGEIRDQETAQACVDACLRGHLVFSTLPTNTAPEAVTRLLEYGIDPLHFADVLIGVLAQRLMRTLCQKCRKAYKPSGEEYDSLLRAFGSKYFPELEVTRDSLKLYRSTGCKSCDHLGYRGRTGIHELLTNSGSMKRVIGKRTGVVGIRALAMHEGMRTLVQDGIAKILKGESDLEQLKKIMAE